MYEMKPDSWSSNNTSMETMADITHVPILKLGQELLTSIQVDLSDVEAEAFQENVLRRVQETEARGIVIDITSLQIVDSFLARVLNDTAAMLHMLGASTVISGIQPAVAITLVEMGCEIIGVQTALDLEQGLQKLRYSLQNEEAML